MLISTKGRYALRVMIDLAQHDQTQYTPLKEIAERQGISEKYSETILKVLVRENMLTGLRGKGGGYKLNRAPEDYTVWDIISIMEEDALLPVACLGAGAERCNREKVCVTLPMWQDLNKTLKEFFEGYKLSDFVDTKLSDI